MVCRVLACRAYCGVWAEASWLSPSGAAMIAWVCGALVDDLRRGIAGDRARAERNAVAAGALEQAGFALAARGGAAEQGFDRLALRVAGGKPDGSGDRRGQRVIGRDDQRRVARDREFIEAAAAWRSNDAQPPSATAETRSRGSDLRMFDFLLGPFRPKQEGAQ